MKTILHIDDDSVVLETYGKKFQEAGFQVVSKAHLESDFVSQIAAIAPDIIVSDVSMPWPNGIEILKAIRSDQRIRHIPFVFLSNSLDCNVDEISGELGALEPMFKLEYPPSEATARIAEWLIGS